MTVHFHGEEYIPSAQNFVRRMRFDLERSRQCLKVAQDHMKHRADRRRCEGPPFNVGPQLLLLAKF